MNQLNGKYVNVVLSVECGRGMDFLKNSVHITANFNGRILESDKIPAEESPQFNTELVWEIDKKELRKIRSANQPLRVECITTDPYNRRERVGFTLLSPRSAQIIPKKNQDLEMKFIWNKLIGCQGDKKKSHPEIFLALALRDHLVNDVEATLSQGAMPYISEEDASTADEVPSSKYALKYFEDGHIQIGDEQNPMTFYLNLLVKEAVNLDALLPEILVFQQNKENYYLSFKILGVAIKTKPFKKELHNTIVMNEKIVVNLLSSREILEEFFKNQNVTISFFYGADKLGVTNVELVNAFEQNNSNCYFKFPSPNGIVPFGSTKKSPHIQITTWVEEKEVEKVIELPEKHRTKTIFSNVSQIPSDQLMQDEPMHEAASRTFITNSVEKMIIPPEFSPRPALDVYQKYVCEITLRNLVWKLAPKDSKLMFKFLHPKASSCITIFTDIDTVVDEEIALSNLEVKIGYISTPAKIEKLLNIWPPRLVLTDEKEKNISDEQELNVNSSNALCMDYDVTLKYIRTLENLAKIGVTVTFKQLGPVDVDDYENLYLLPVVLDEIITVKEIGEVQQWKEREKLRFEEELVDVKGEEIRKLGEEWDAKKKKLEDQLSKSIEKCKSLQDDLIEKANSFKTDRMLQRRANNSNIYEYIFNENWNRFNSDNSKELIEDLSKSQRDNELLKDMLEKQREKLDKIEKSALTKAQTTNLLLELRGLEEKFEEVQTAKGFFKEEWKRACDEIHELKTEDMKNMQLQIKLSKEELSQLEVESISDDIREENIGDFRQEPVDCDYFF